MAELDSRHKGSRWLSLLSVLMAARIKPLDVVLAERAECGEWDLAFWNYDPDELVCTYRCGPNKTIWVPIETPVYSGRIRPWEKLNDPRKRDPRSK